VLLTQEKAAARDAFQKHARLKGATELSVPSEIVVVDRVPLLGSGKPDYVAALDLAKTRVQGASAASASDKAVADATTPVAANGTAAA
jgi:acyl-[acyl-carrier-protein]-phospholipid O-acyltransferase/long-chain-fatty-acid--[acyl-carrier-protein] ligase